jgi:hypothetical protein
MLSRESFPGRLPLDMMIWWRPLSNIDNIYVQMLTFYEDSIFL